jgi:hypothetical protein
MNKAKLLFFLAGAFAVIVLTCGAAPAVFPYGVRVTGDVDVVEGQVLVDGNPIGGGSVSEIANLPTSENDTAKVLHPNGEGGVAWGEDSSGTVPEIANLPTAENDPNKVLRPNGEGGVAWGLAPSGEGEGDNLGNHVMSSNLLPAANNELDLGSPDMMLRGAYFGTGGVSVAEAGAEDTSILIVSGAGSTAVNGTYVWDEGEIAFVIEGGGKRVASGSEYDRDWLLSVSNGEGGWLPYYLGDGPDIEWTGFHMYGESPLPTSAWGGGGAGSVMRITPNGIVFPDDTTQTTAAVSGGSVSEIANLPTSESDTSKVLKPNGSGGVVWGEDSGSGAGDAGDNLGNHVISSNLLPAANNELDLGSPDMVLRGVYAGTGGVSAVEATPGGENQMVIVVSGAGTHCLNGEYVLEGNIYTRNTDCGSGPWARIAYDDGQMWWAIQLYNGEAWIDYYRNAGSEVVSQYWGPGDGGESPWPITAFGITEGSTVATKLLPGGVVFPDGSTQTTAAAVSEITSIPTAETDGTLVLKPSGSGGVVWGGVPAPVVEYLSTQEGDVSRFLRPNGEGGVTWGAGDGLGDHVVSAPLTITENNAFDLGSPTSAVRGVYAGTGGVNVVASGPGEVDYSTVVVSGAGRTCLNGEYVWDEGESAHMFLGASCEYGSGAKIHYDESSFALKMSNGEGGWITCYTSPELVTADGAYWSPDPVYGIMPGPETHFATSEGSSSKLRITSFGIVFPDGSTQTTAAVSGGGDNLGNHTMTANLMPEMGDYFDIGSADNVVRSLYLGSNSLHVGGVVLSDVGNSLRIGSTGVVLTNVLVVYGAGTSGIDGTYVHSLNEYEDNYWFRTGGGDLSWIYHDPATELWDLIIELPAGLSYYTCTAGGPLSGWLATTNGAEPVPTVTYGVSVATGLAVRVGGIVYPDGSTQTTAAGSGAGDNLGNHSAVSNVLMGESWRLVWHNVELDPSTDSEIAGLPDTGFAFKDSGRENTVSFNRDGGGAPQSGDVLKYTGSKWAAASNSNVSLDLPVVVEGTNRVLMKIRGGIVTEIVDPY